VDLGYAVRSIDDRFDSDTRALIERALADVIPTMGYE
jgi:omega-hydroxy-beta-dihydromenaquinone-9 sulfotransferase